MRRSGHARGRALTGAVRVRRRGRVRSICDGRRVQLAGRRDTTRRRQCEWTRRARPGRHWTLAQILVNLGSIELALGRSASALELLERAAKLREAANLTGSDAAFGEFALARALDADGRDPARAVALAKRALAHVGDPSHPDHAKITAWLRAHGQ